MLTIAFFRPVQKVPKDTKPHTSKFDKKKGDEDEKKAKNVKAEPIEEKHHRRHFEGVLKETLEELLQGSME